MADRFAGPAPRSIKLIALGLGMLCLLGMSGLGLFYSLDREIEEKMMAGEQSSRGSTLNAYPDLFWRQFMRRAFPADYGGRSALARGPGSMTQAFIDQEIDRANNLFLAWLARPFSEHLVTTYIEKKRLMLYFANNWPGPPRGLDHRAIARFGKPPVDLAPAEQLELVFAVTGTPEELLPHEVSSVLRALLRACESLPASRIRPAYCGELPEAIKSGSTE